MRAGTRRWDWAQGIALIIGLTYGLLLAVGLTTAQGSLAGPNPENVFGGLGFSAVLHVYYGAIAVLGLLAATKAAGSQAYCWFVFFAFSGLTAYGLLAAASDAGDRLNIEWTSVALYIVTALIALGTGLASLRTRKVEAGQR